jgi:oligopeptidase B
MNKKNTFNDFIDCAEYLIREKWTSKDRLLIEVGVREAC